jgi:hypothetical protein
VDLIEHNHKGISRRHLLDAYFLKPSIVRAAELRDVPAIVNMRGQYYRRIDSPVPPRGDGVYWLVGERDGRVLAAAGVVHFPTGLRHVCDFVRDERRFTSIPALVAVGRAICEKARHDGAPLQAFVPRQNAVYEEVLVSSGEWEAIAYEPLGTRYQFVGVG